MLKELEEAIAERINTKLASVHRVAIDEAHSPNSLKLPGVDVIVGGGKFVRVAQNYKLKASVYVVVTFQHLRSVADRRAGVYPILESIAALLIGNQFELKVDALTPVRLDNITEKEEAEAGKIVFQIEFETGFIITKQSDEELVDLLTIGLNYYLQDPADAVVDATDIITCEAIVLDESGLDIITQSGATITVE